MQYTITEENFCEAGYRQARKSTAKFVKKRERLPLIKGLCLLFACAVVISFVGFLSYIGESLRADVNMEYLYKNAIPKVKTKLFTGSPNAKQDELDSDGDGLTDAEEIKLRTGLYNADSDHDGLNDGLEKSLGTNPKQWKYNSKSSKKKLNLTDAEKNLQGLGTIFPGVKAELPLNASYITYTGDVFSGMQLLGKPVAFFGYSSSLNLEFSIAQNGDWAKAIKKSAKAAGISADKYSIVAVSYSMKDDSYKKLGETSFKSIGTLRLDAKKIPADNPFALVVMPTDKLALLDILSYKMQVFLNRKDPKETFYVANAWQSTQIIVQEKKSVVDFADEYLENIPGFKTMPSALIREYYSRSQDKGATQDKSGFLKNIGSAASDFLASMFAGDLTRINVTPQELFLKYYMPAIDFKKSAKRLDGTQLTDLQTFWKQPYYVYAPNKDEKFSLKNSITTVPTKSTGRKVLAAADFRPAKNAFPFVAQDGYALSMALVAAKYYNTKKLAADDDGKIAARFKSQGLVSPQDSVWQPFKKNSSLQSLQLNQGSPLDLYLRKYESQMLESTYLRRKDGANDSFVQITKLIKSLSENKVATVFLVGKTTAALVVWRIEQDCVDMNKYYLQVYDPNFPKGEIALNDENNVRRTIPQSCEITLTVQHTRKYTKNAKGEFVGSVDSYFLFSYGEENYHWGNDDKTYHEIGSEDQLRFVSFG
jgi:hypothetical protein